MNSLAILFPYDPSYIEVSLGGIFASQAKGYLTLFLFLIRVGKIPRKITYNGILK